MYLFDSGVFVFTLLLSEIKYSHEKRVNKFHITNESKITNTYSIIIPLVIIKKKVVFEIFQPFLQMHNITIKNSHDICFIYYVVMTKTTLVMYSF